MYFILEKCPGADGIGVSIDIALHGPTEEEHDSNLHNLKLVARKHELVFILDKCVIKETFNIEFLFDAPTFVINNDYNRLACKIAIANLGGPLKRKK